MSDERDLKLHLLQLADGDTSKAQAMLDWLSPPKVDEWPEAVWGVCGPHNIPPGSTFRAAADGVLYVLFDDMIFKFDPADKPTPPERTSEPETHTGNGGEEFLLDEGQRAPDESSSQASSTDAPAWQRFRASEGWHTFAGVRDYEYFTFLEGVKFEMAIVGGGRVIVTSPGPGVKLDEPVRNVEAYRIIDAKADEVGETTSELDSSSEPQAATEQEQKDESTPVLDALPPSIPRSEIPEGAAVETFTDTGVETVKIGGLTHIVEQAPEPIQNGDASVFAHGIIREADEPEARRFDLSRLFGGKAKVDA